MTKEHMNIEQLVLSMFRAISSPPTEEWYKILGISKLNILKRRRFSNIYGTLVIFLIKLSLPGAFPTHSTELVETFNNYFQRAYEDHPTTRDNIEERLAIFEELTKDREKDPFLDLARYLTELFDRSPRRIVYTVKLNKVIEDMFFNFLTMGKTIDIIDGQSQTENKQDYQQMAFAAEALNNQGRHYQVLELLLPAAEYPDNQNISFFNEIGIAYGKIGSKNKTISFWVEAYKYHRKVYELNSSEPMYMFNLAMAALWLDKTVEALDLFNKYLATGHKRERKLALDTVNELESL